MRSALAWILIGLMAGACGCAQPMVGTWTTESVEPAGAAAEYQLASVTFNDDGTYSSTVTHEGKPIEARGTWQYDGRTLQMAASCGAQRCYDASFRGGKELVIADSRNGDKITVRMKKAGARGVCSCAGCDRSKCPESDTCTKQCPKAACPSKPAACPKSGGDANACPTAAVVPECPRAAAVKACPAAAARKPCCPHAAASNTAP